jgi:dihydroorotase
LSDHSPDQRLIFRGATVIDPDQGIEGTRTVVVEDGRISDLLEGDGPAARPGDELIDAKGRWLLPGLIDLHAHLREPGEEYKETLATGGAAAAAGGFTALVAMPNTRPPIDSAALVEYVVRRAAATCPVRVYPAGAVSLGQKGEVLAEIGDMKAAGAVVLTDDGRPIMNASLMRRALEYARTFDLPVSVHEEDLNLVAGGCMHEGAVATRLGLAGIPSQAEEAMVLRDLALCELTSGRLHLAHLSTAGSVRAVRAAKARGLPVTAEATPHHFTLTDAAVAGYDTDTKMNPPLRAAEDLSAVREGLADGTLDAIATDHAPHSPVEKDLEFDRAANGVVGLETALALGLRLVAEKVLSPRRLVELLTIGPARTFGLPGGTLRRGVAADLTLVDPNAEWTVEPSRLLSRSKNTPFKGWRLKGQVMLTAVAGRVVYRRALR